MSRLLVVILYYATLAAAVTESIKVHGQPNHDMVNSMYHAFGGSWNLSTSGVTGFERAAISHLIFHPMSNATGYANSTSASKVKREYPDVATPTCYNPGDKHGIFTIQEQQWIVGAFCSTFSQATIPFAFTGLAMIVDEVWCRTWDHYAVVCRVAIEMGLTQGATSFAMAWGQACVKNYAAIENVCGESGGTTSAVTPGSVTYQNGGWQLTTVTFTTTVYASTGVDLSLTTVCPAGGYCKEWTCAATVCNEPPN